jgi:hypothetical protein
MTTEITQRIIRNQRQSKEKKNYFKMAKMAGPDHEKIRGLISFLEHEALSGKEPGKRKKALDTLLFHANAMKIECCMLENELKGMGNGDNARLIQKLAKTEKCFDCVCFALERIAQSCDDKMMRHRAFGFIKFNPVAVKLTYELTTYPDIKLVAGNCLPKKPNKYYSFIGEDFKNREENFKGIALRLLAYLRNKELSTEERNRMQKQAREMLDVDHVGWGQAQEIARDVRVAINSIRKIKKLNCITQKELADMVEGYLGGKKVAELTDAFMKVKGMRLVGLS